MKNLFLILTLLPGFISAQDSTYIQYSSESTEGFEPEKLVDEFEKAFGLDKEVKFRAKVGLKSYDVFLLNTTKAPEISGELKLFKQNSVKANLSFTPRSFLSFGNYPLLDLEWRRYLKHKNEVGNLSGAYVSISKTFNFGEAKSFPDYYWSGGSSSIGQNRYIEPLRSFQIDIGQQYGSVLDVGLRLGLKKVRLNAIDEAGLKYASQQRPFLPYISSYSSINLGLDLPNRESSSQKCSFLNCHQKINHLLKVDMSGMFYIDKYTQNIQTDLSYEQKFGKLPLSILLGARFSLNRFESFDYIGYKNIDSDFGQSTLSLYSSSTSNKLNLSTQFYGELRYYVFQKRQIAQGKMIAGLQGPYLGVYYSVTPIDTRISGFDNFQYLPWRNSSYGPLLGYQRKISKKYFIDVGLRFQDSRSYNISIGKVVMAPQFKFGYAF
ncbi:MAG: hypothetical protein NXI00_03110 [Cytophagales bacterium]|nr:hypothetical protein [Cytophagales bacterium]